MAKRTGVIAVFERMRWAKAKKGVLKINEAGLPMVNIIVLTAIAVDYKLRPKAVGGAFI